MVSLVVGVVGVLVGVLTLGQGLAILTFGIPTASRWLREGRLLDARPMWRCQTTLLSLAAILVTSLAAVWLVLPQHLVSFAVGLGVGVIGAVGGLRKRDDLLIDFLQLNASSIGPSLPETQDLKGLSEEARRLGVSPKEIAATPEWAMQIVGEFGRLMEQATTLGRPTSPD